MNKDDITRREAQKMVNMGVYETVEEAWSEAEEICYQSDAYEIVEDYKRDLEYEEDREEDEED